MKKEDIIRKLTSRKLWMAVALFVSGIITAVGGKGEFAETVSGCIMQLASVVGHLLRKAWQMREIPERGYLNSGRAGQRLALPILSQGGA